MLHLEFDYKYDDRKVLFICLCWSIKWNLSQFRYGTTDILNWRVFINILSLIYIFKCLPICLGQKKIPSRVFQMLNPLRLWHIKYKYVTFIVYIYPESRIILLIHGIFDITDINVITKYATRDHLAFTTPKSFFSCRPSITDT